MPRRVRAFRRLAWPPPMGLGRPSAALELIDRAAHMPFDPVAGFFPRKRLPQRGERLRRAQGRQCPAAQARLHGSASASASISNGTAGR